MDAVTYPNQDVIDWIDQQVIPVRIPFDSPLAGEFVAKWTPNLVFVDKQRKVHHRIIGFLPPEELIPAMGLGVGKIFFETKELDRAVEMLDNVIEKHPVTHAAPEAVYFRGVSEYMKTHKGDPLKAVYKTLQEKYPKSEWATRAAPYRLL